MESVAAMLGDWNSFNGGVQFTEEACFMAQMLGSFPLPNDSLFEVPSTFWPQHHDLTVTVDEVDETSIYLSDNTRSNPQHCLLTDDGGSSTLSPTSNDCLTERGEILVPRSTRKDNNKVSASSRKRSCGMADDVEENKEKIKRRKSQKLVSESEADHDAVFGQIMKMCGSDNDSNWSRESSTSPRPKEEAANGKTKANRGSATDPQSVYARKRRERINERLRILQGLVPNGTKVDISTMLEDAVQYVKFLQLQIKLLSSDDLWMYAPIAYNGMEMGLDSTIPSPR